MKKDIDGFFKYNLIAVFSIGILCIIIYSNTLQAPFVFDDRLHIPENRQIKLTNLDFQGLYDSAFKSPLSNRPVANISFALNYYFGGYDVTGYHMVNITIHVINGILVYFLALAIFSHIRLSLAQTLNHSTTGQIFSMSLFSALLFIAHPVQIQSVTYIVQRMNSMSVMFYLLSLFFYIRARLSRAKRRRWVLFLSCSVSWIIALGSKEIAVTLPFIILLYEWYFFQNLNAAWIKRNAMYLLVPISILCLLAFIYKGGNPFHEILAEYSQYEFTMSERVLTQFRVVIFYLSLLTYPHPSRFNLEHYFTTSHSLLDPITTLLSLLIILGLVAFAIFLVRKNRLISFGILWFFINLVIESSVIALDMIFEHRLYLPMFGFALIVSYLTFHFLSNKRSLAVVISAVITLSLGTATNIRNRVWQNNITLWSDVVTKNPQNQRAHSNLGVALKDADRTDEAIRHYSKALRINPWDVEVHNNMGNALDGQGKTDEAIDHYLRALQIDPMYARAHRNLGVVLGNQGRINEAISHFSKALRINPELAEAHNSLGVILANQGKTTEAIKHFSEELWIDAENAKTHNNLGIALANEGRIAEAIKHFSEALRIDPRYADAHNGLGFALTKEGRMDKAVSHFFEALRINPRNAEAHNGLGASLATQGRITEAIKHFSEALRIDPAHAHAQINLKNALALQEDLKTDSETPITNDDGQRTTKSDQ